MPNTCFSADSGTNWSCFRISVSRCPRASCACVTLSSWSEPNCAKAASSRYCAMSSRSEPATCRIALICALPQARVQIEYVAWEGFAPGWPAKQQRNFAVGLRVLRKVVVKGHCVAPVIAEVLAHGARGVGRNVLQRSRLSGGGRHHDGIVHRARVGQGLHHLRDRRTLLPDSTVDANDVAAFLIDDGVQDDRGFARLAVADDQLALPAADRNHAVDCFDARLERLADRLAVEHAWSDALERIALLCQNGALAVHRLAKRIHNSAHQRFADRHGHNRVRALDDVAFLQFRRFAEQHHADLFFLEVQRDAVDLVRKGQHLAGHDLFQAMNARNAVADADNRANFVHRNGLLVVLNLLAQNLADFVCLDVGHACSVAPAQDRVAARAVRGGKSLSIQIGRARASRSSDSATSHHKSCPRSARPRRPATPDRANTLFRFSCPSGEPGLPPALFFAPRSIPQRKKSPLPPCPAAAESPVGTWR